jgi:hypothetical protein
LIDVVNKKVIKERVIKERVFDFPEEELERIKRLRLKDKNLNGMCRTRMYARC